jgi:hypothetical protein
VTDDVSPEEQQEIEEVLDKIEVVEDDETTEDDAPA